jgi:hypothetical protein
MKSEKLIIGRRITEKVQIKLHKAEERKHFLKGKKWVKGHYMIKTKKL